MELLTANLGRTQISKKVSFTSIEDIALVTCKMCQCDTPEDHMVILDCPSAPRGQPKGKAVCVGCAQSRGWVCADAGCGCQAVV